MTTTLRSMILDGLERAGWSAGQTLVAVLLTTGGITDVRNLHWGLALGTAVGAFVVSVLTTALLYLSSLTLRSFWADLVLRLAKTFVAAFAGAIGADAFNAFTFDWSTALSIAVLATLGALGKGLLARQETAGGNNPSTLVPATYTANPVVGNSISSRKQNSGRRIDTPAGQVPAGVEIGAEVR